MFAKNKRGYSLLGWTVTFAVVLAAVTIIQTLVKDSLKRKVWHTSDYMLWGQWDEEKQEVPNVDSTMRSKAVIGSQAPYRAGVLETDDGVTLRQSESDQRNSRINSGVNAGSDAYLRTFDLNNAFDTP